MMLLNRLSIRTRITLGSLLLAGVFFAGAGLVVHGAVQGVIYNATVALLRSDSAPYVTAIRHNPGATIDSPGEGQLVAVLNPAGKKVQSTLPKALSRRASSLVTGGDDPQSVTAGRAQYLILVTSVKSSGGTWIIVSAVNQATSALLLMNLTRDIGLGFAGLAVLFGFASWLMTSTALRPVARLRRSAELLVESGSTEMLEVGPARDEVTELAQTLNDLILDLRAAAEREKHMVSDASHELRTPLAILQSQLELIRTGDKSTLSSDLAAAEMAAHRMGTLVSNLLELSRLEASPQIGIATVRELAEELVEAVDRARLAAAKTDIIVDFELPQAEDALAERVAISAHNFGRVVGNLVINAIKAMASAGGTGTVQATLTVASGQATLVVADTGPGITESYLPRAFDRFSHDEDAGAGVPTMASGSDRMGVSSGSAALAGSAGAAGLAGSREHGGTAEPGQPGRVSQPVGVGRPGQVGQPVGGAQLVGSGGTGLGLSIVAAIVKASHGTITLSNIPGAGLSAVVVLATIPHGG